MQPPEHRHRQYHYDRICNHIYDCNILLKPVQISAFPIWACFIKAVGDRSADKAGGYHDGCEDHGVKAYNSPAGVAKATYGEDADVEEEHRDADADSCRVPNHFEGDEDLH